MHILSFTHFGKMGLNYDSHIESHFSIIIKCYLLARTCLIGNRYPLKYVPVFKLSPTLQQAATFSLLSSSDLSQKLQSLLYFVSAS